MLCDQRDRIVSPWTRDLMTGAVYRELPDGTRCYVTRSEDQAARKAEVDARLRKRNLIVLDTPPGCLIERPAEPAPASPATPMPRVYRES